MLPHTWLTKRSEILKSDESCISNPEIRNCELDYDAVVQPVQSKISDFGI